MTEYVAIIKLPKRRNMQFEYEPSIEYRPETKERLFKDDCEEDIGTEGCEALACALYNDPTLYENPHGRHYFEDIDAEVSLTEMVELAQGILRGCESAARGEDDDPLGDLQRYEPGCWRYVQDLLERKIEPRYLTLDGKRIPRDK